MSHLPVTTRSHNEDPPSVVEGQLVDLSTRGLEHPPAERYRCRCGKDGTPKAHGGRTCNEILAMRANHANAARLARRARPWLIAGSALAVVASIATISVLLVLGITSIVAIATSAVAWLSTHWPAIAIALAVLLLMGGSAKCAGLHCGGCRG